MKHLKKNKISLAFLPVLSLLSLTGCLGTSHLSTGITDSGKVLDGEVVFPNIEDAWQKNGLRPNMQNLASISQGTTKDELVHLIGRPQFNESHNAREWDYTLNLKTNSGEYQTCQYKIIFDTDYTAQDFYWNPVSCESLVNINHPTTIVYTEPKTQRSEPKTQRVSLNSDALFAFDKYKPSDMLPQGRQGIYNLAKSISQTSDGLAARVVVTGHTDRLGDDAYNMNLSQLRAQTVRKMLIEAGVEPKYIIAVGAGESEPVKSCPDKLSKSQQISCLSENRRVTVDYTVYK